MVKKIEKPNMGLSTHQQKKLACEIWYESVNNLKIVKKRKKKKKKKFQNPIVGLSTNHKKKLACEIWYQ